MPMKNLSFRWQILLPVILLGSFLLVNFGFYSSRQTLIDGDGNGYYAYLPAIFIYHTIDFKEFAKVSPARDEKYHQPHYFFQKNDVLVNKYTCGTALLQAPMFLTALGLSALTGLETNGYTILFQYSVALSGLIFLYLGLHFLRKLLQSYQIREQLIIIAIMSILFATNLFFYAFVQPSFSHVYSFFAITLFAFSVRKYFTGGPYRMLLLAAFALGLVVLIRPVNVLVLLAVPFLAGVPYSSLTTEALRGLHGAAWRKNFHLVCTVSGIFLLTISPQLVILTLQTGSPFQWLYPGEGFNFGHPHIIDFLFSYKKGWFVYTPFMLLLIPGLIVLIKRSKFEFITFLCFLLFAIYLFSAWWNWFYGDGFGMRPMVDYYGMFLVPVSLFLDRISGKTGKIFTGSFIILSAGLNLIQSYQYAKEILHPDSMNKKAYWYTFLRTSAPFEGVIGLSQEIVYGTISSEPLIRAFQDFEQDGQGWIKLQEADTGNAFSGNHLLKLDSNNVYSYGYSLLVDKKLQGRNDLYVAFSVHYYEPAKNSAATALFVADVLDSQYRSLYYRNIKLECVPDRITGRWRKAEAGFRLPVLHDDAIQIRFYIWNKDRQTFFLDDMEIRLYEILYN
jgi:hypothetical protein